MPQRNHEDSSPAPPNSTSPSRPADSTNPNNPASYNNVPPDEIQNAEQNYQETAAQFFNTNEAKHPRNENFTPGFSSALPSGSIPVSHKISKTKKIEIPNARVADIVSKTGETIRHLQLQSGATIQVTRDMDIDPDEQTRLVTLMGTPEEISKAEQLITDLLSKEGSGSLSRSIKEFWAGDSQYQMTLASNKVGLLTGKYGRTIRSIQAKSGACIQLIPLLPLHGDTSTERTVYIDGTTEQIVAAKQLINEVVSEVTQPEQTQLEH
ncbi:hypothetical protein MKW92_006862 [Papaver armeniacum]|nr:hypothetical protein MKW92_006862 [Papaver armeniacum]